LRVIPIDFGGLGCGKPDSREWFLHNLCPPGSCSYRFRLWEKRCRELFLELSASGSSRFWQEPASSSSRVEFLQAIVLAFVRRFDVSDEFKGRPEIKNNVFDLLAASQDVFPVICGDDIAGFQGLQSVYKGFDGIARLAVAVQQPAISFDR